MSLPPRANAKRTRTFDQADRVVPYITGGCSCGKRLYATRKDAKVRARQMRTGGDGRYDAYPCPSMPGAGYHIGHHRRDY